MSFEYDECGCWPIEKFSFRYQYFALIDTADYLADQLFIKHMPQYYHEGCPNERTAPGNSPQELKARHLSYSDLNTLAAEGYAILMNGRDSHAGHLGIVFPIVNLLQGGFR